MLLKLTRSSGLPKSEAITSNVPFLAVKFVGSTRATVLFILSEEKMSNFLDICVPEVIDKGENFVLRHLFM